MPGSQQRGKGKRHTPLRSDAHFIQAKRSAELQVGAVTDEREQWKKTEARPKRQVGFWAARSLTTYSAMPQGWKKTREKGGCSKLTMGARAS